MSRSDIPEGSSETARPDRTTLIAFVLMVVSAGGNPVAVRFSNFELPPFWGAAIRFAAAALVFWIIVLVRRITLPKGRALIGVLLYGLLAVGASYAFLYWGLLRVPAGLAGAVLAFVPLMTLFFAWAHGLETLRWRGLMGALIATAGILVGIVRGFGSTVHVPSLLAMVAGTACLAEASVIFKLFPQSHPVATNALALTTGTPPLIVLSLLAGEEWSLPTTPNTWASFAYLVLIGSVVVFYLYLHVLARWTASATSYSFLLIPVATVVIAAWLAGEVITASFVIGGALVLAGVWVGAIHSSPEAAGVKVDFVDGLTDLRHVEGTFDFLVDYGSMDEMVGRARSRYADMLLKLSARGSLCLFAFTRWPERWWVRLNPFAMRPGEVERRFGSHFDLEPTAGSADWVAYLMKRR